MRSHLVVGTLCLGLSCAACSETEQNTGFEEPPAQSSGGATTSTSGQTSTPTAGSEPSGAGMSTTTAGGSSSTSAGASAQAGSSTTQGGSEPQAGEAQGGQAQGGTEPQGGDAQGGESQGGSEPEGGESAGGSSAGGGGEGGMTMNDPFAPIPSTGCGQDPGQPLEEYQRYTLTPAEVGAACSDRIPPEACDAGANLNVAMDADMMPRTDREYFVRLPANYDPTKAYRLVMIAMGCYDQAEEKAYHFYEYDEGEAILVTMQYVGTPDDPCFDDFIVDSPDFPFIAAVHQNLLDNFCVDENRVFFGGYSSGGWITNSVACLFGGDGGWVRAVGVYTGGLPPYLENNEWTCSPGPTPAIFFHDSMDMDNPIAKNELARDRLLEANGCQGTDTEPYMLGFGASDQPCARYTGCPDDYPVVWCETTGVPHSDSNDALVGPGFWSFFSEF